VLTVHVEAILRTFRNSEKLQDKTETDPISLLGRTGGYVFNEGATAGEADTRSDGGTIIM
jgi:hypothetical protein